MGKNKDGQDNKEDKNRGAFQRVIEKSEDDFEKLITYISAGALGLSITFIEKIVDLSDSTSLVFLISGWFLLVLALCVNLSSHYISSKLVQKSLEEYDNNDPNLNENIDSRNRKINRINIFTIVTLILGIASIVLFVTLNILNHGR